MKKILVPALIFGVVSVAGFTAFADTAGIPMSGKGNQIQKAAIIQALKENTYASLPDAVKAKITAEKFAQARIKYLAKVEEKENKKQVGKDHNKKNEHEKGQEKGRKHMQSEAVQKAIESGDYATFREAKIAQIPTETEFKEMIARHTKHKAFIVTLQAALKNNDFTAFKKAHEEMKTSMAEFHAEDEMTPKTPDEEEMKKHFNEMVAQYKADGTLPERFGKKGMKKGERMHEGK